MLVFDLLEKKRKEYGTLSLALIDPDSKNDSKLDKILNNINRSQFDGILVGGSLIEDDKFEERISIIKNSTTLPIVIFPGDSSQLSNKADAILYMSLISGRNPKFLIEEQVKSSIYIYENKLEAIPTGYILLKTDKKSAVQIVSKTEPISMDNIQSIISHSLAAQYMGKKMLFLETGSNANYPVNLEIVKKISSIIDIPLIVGGGIKTSADALALSEHGASYIVIGSLLEETDNHSQLLEINKVIRS